jgi:uncharacterized protein DUF6603
MPTQAGTLEVIARELGLALAALEAKVKADSPENFIAELGLRPPPTLVADAQFVNSVVAVATAAAGLPTPIEDLITALEGDDSDAIISAGAALLSAIAKVLSAISDLGTALHTLASAVAGLTPAQVTQLQTFAQALPRKLFDFTVIEYLASKGSTVVPTLALTGLIEDTLVQGNPADPMSPPMRSRVLHFERLGDIFSNPGNFLTSTFQWGSPGFDGTVIFSLLQTLLDAFDLPSNILKAPGQPPIFEAYVLRLSANTSTNPPGLDFRLRLPAIQDYTRTYQLSDLWALNVNVGARFEAGMGATIQPPVKLSLTPPTGTINIQASAGFSAQHADGTPIVLLGQTGGSVLQTQSMGGSFGFNATWDSGSGTAQGEPTVGLKITAGKLYIDMSQADGFLADILGDTQIQSTFDIAATWEPDTGLHITGGAQLEIDLPLHLDLGPITLPTLYLVGGIGSSGFTLELSAALGLTLGPIQASVDRIGVLGNLTFPNGGGNLGPADLQIQFKPPNGLGLAIDAGVAAGGGYIFFDNVKKQYAGVFALSILDVIQVDIIGLLDTIMPDGSSGFSFLLIITFSFPPIQLGFGFTLDTVGGIGGVNRTMCLDALHAGFMAHTLSDVIAPVDPIANAPQIISDLRNFFPVAVGRYLFGPIVGLGWGDPTLIELTLGVILEIPDPIRLVILGLIDAGLPTPDEALIELHIDILGIVDFGAKTLSIDGGLYDSRIVIYSLAGDLALRLSWGDNPNFVFSLGGFNPHFNTTALNVPQMHRMSVSIGDGDNPRISSNSYFAVTSNSLQFGANVEAYAAAGGFSIHGYLGFDVLIIISPFSFEFDFSAGFDVAYNGTTLAGLNVDGTLSGPTPFHLHGDASITFLCFSVSASVDLTWGDSTQATLPQQPVLPDLYAALQSPASWSAALPDGAATAVTLVTQNPADKTLRVHPMGTLQVKEKVVPLDLPITRYGSATPSDGSEFSIASVQVNTQTESTQAIQDYFAAGQFLTLSDADKISRPSFEKYDAGIIIGSNAVTQGQDAHRPVTYQEHYIDDPASFSRFSRYYYMRADLHMALSAQGAGFASAAKNTGMAKYQSPSAPAAIKVQEPQYVVTSAVDLSLRSDILGSSTSYFKAQAALQNHLAAHPEEAGNVQIMPMHEAPA